MIEKLKVRESLINYVFEKSDLDKKEDIPLNSSLLAEGVLDSFGIIELVEFIELNWDIKINDEEFTLEKMGSIEKMKILIEEKISS
jgi:acyl carrier protein|tara:strand:+ start:762 stop:1019 length:258 start_codon:yes stop_codon:yes gene_type:complete